MLNIIIQKAGAHSETISLFIEMLEKDCSVFYPATNEVEVIGYEPSIKKRYGVSFIKSDSDLFALIGSRTDHGLLIFNTASETKQEWAPPVMAAWKGRIAVYHHEMHSFEPGPIQLYAHPFMNRQNYLLPVADVFQRDEVPQPGQSQPMIVLPNWTRPSHLQNKNLDFLAKCLEDERSKNCQFIMTGMSMDIMSKAIQGMSGSDKIKIIHRPTVETLSNLLMRDFTYVMPLIRPGGRYSKLGLTGTIPLAFNHGCPVIISEEIAAAYDVKWFVDEADFFSEILACNNSEAYGRNVAQVLVERNRISIENKRKFTRALA